MLRNRIKIFIFITRCTILTNTVNSNLFIQHQLSFFQPLRSRVIGNIFLIHNWVSTKQSDSNTTKERQWRNIFCCVSFTKKFKARSWKYIIMCKSKTRKRENAKILRSYHMTKRFLYLNQKQEEFISISNLSCFTIFSQSLGFLLELFLV